MNFTPKVPQWILWYCCKGSLPFKCYIFYLLQPSLHFNHTIILLPPMWFHCSKAAFCEMTRFVNLWHCTHLANTPMHPVNLDCATVAVGPKINQWYTPTNHRCFEIRGPKKIFGGWRNIWNKGAEFKNKSWEVFAQFSSRKGEAEEELLV